MTPELEKALQEKYPLWLRDLYGDLRTTSLTWGIECGNGWFAILDRLGSKIEKLLVAMKNKGVEDLPKARQIKEKYGELRVYMDWCTEDIDKAIRQAEEESHFTCEKCGEVGELDEDSSWLSVLCKTCRRE